MKKALITFIIAFIIPLINGYAADKTVKIIRSSTNIFNNIRKNTRAGSAFKKFNSGYNNKWKVKYNKISKKIERLFGFSTKPLGGDLKEAGLIFLRQNRELFEIDTDALKFISQKEIHKFIHVSYKQYYKDIPIENGFIKMNYLKDGRLIHVKSKYVYDIDLPVVPNISARAGITRALQDLNPIKYDRDNIGSALVVYYNEKTGKNHLCYRISISSEEPLGAFIYYIDALDNQVVDKLNVLIDISKGSNKGYILPLYHTNVRILEPIKNAYITVGGVNTVTSGTQGEFYS